MTRVRLFEVTAAVVAVVDCSTNAERARIVVPGTELALVLEEDEKQMTRYHFSVRDSRVSEEGFLGPYGGPPGKDVAVSAEGGRTRISWSTPLNTQYVVVDPASCAVVAHSNTLAQPPRLVRCR